ncbi:class F sortase [Candidatus Microgenomates bacterium]|nr:class F sortase [Candidatus Microgenomates bacterium]
MYRIIAIAYIGLLFVVFLFVFARVDQSASQDLMIASSKTMAHIVATDTPAPTIVPTATPSPTPTPQPIGQPVRLVIPRLSIDTTIESKGNDSEGHMDVPVSWSNVAWYNLGSKPGESGAAIIAGHYDNSSGGPAAFYYLSALQPGDDIYVVDELGKTLIFKVIDKRTYNYDLFPVDAVFNDHSGHKLNLITCSGIWDRMAHNYTDRLVVFSELQ